MDGSEATRWANSRSFRTWQDRDKNNANFSTFEMRRHLKGVSGAPGTPVQVALNSRETVDRLRADIDSGRRGVMVLKRKLMSAKAALDRAVTTMQL
jgi:hypothetical protein